MKKKITLITLALVGAWAAAFANQESLYGTWTYQSGPLTDTHTVSADEVVWQVTIGGTTIGYMTITGLTWTAVNNSDATTMGDYPSGYSIEGTITSVSGDMLSGFSVGEVHTVSLFINSNNTQVFNGVYIYSNGGTTSIKKTFGADIMVRTEGRSIIVENATESVSVYDISGHCVARRAAARHGSTTEPIAVPQAGVYMVRVGSEVQKVMVK